MDQHTAILADWLPRVGRNPRAVGGYAFLTGGASGSYTYRLWGAEGQCVLKVAQPASPPYVRRRARREIKFYRTLASALPLRVPRMLASALGRADSGCALLLAACERPLGPFAWRDADYLELAGQLARLHAAFWGRADQLAHWQWLRPPAKITQMDLRRARQAWRAIWDQPQNADILSAARRQRFRRLLAQIADVPRLTAGLPLTLCHNDCHIDNLLREAGGGLVWADWQEVGAGYGPDDLSFFIQRATAAGARPPVKAMVDEYCQQLAALIGGRVAADAVRRHMATFELRTRLVYWPAYLASAAPDQLRAQVDRIEELAQIG